MNIHKAILAAMTAGCIAIGSGLIWAVEARADDAPACVSKQFMEDSISASVPDAKFGDMNEAETQNLLVKINAALLPEDAIIADSATIGYSSGKKSVLIALFKSGCMVKITYMEVGAFMDAYPGIV